MLAPDFPAMNPDERRSYDEAFEQSKTVLCDCCEKNHAVYCETLVEQGRVYLYWVCIRCGRHRSKAEVDALMRTKIDPEDGLYLPLKDAPEPAFEYLYSIAYRIPGAGKTSTNLRPGTTHEEAVEFYKWYVDGNSEEDGWTDIELRRRPAEPIWETIAMNRGHS